MVDSDFAGKARKKKRATQVSVSEKVTQLMNVCGGCVRRGDIQPARSRLSDL